MSSTILIISGGNIDEEWAEDYINNHSFDYVIAVDRGINYIFKYNIIPNEICGDYDSVNAKALEYYEKNESIIKIPYNIEKDDTDTQAAIKRAVYKGLADFNNDFEICVLGATGSRIDHMLGSIHGLIYSHKNNIKAYIIDKNNKIYFGFNKTVIRKNEQYGKYVSLIPMSDTVTGITLKGFKYIVENYDLSIEFSRGVSNEILDDEAEISFDEGYLLVIESKDWVIR